MLPTKSILMIRLSRLVANASILVLLSAVRCQEEARMFLNISAAKDCYVSQPTVVDITVGYEDAWFQKHAVALFRQKVGVPIHIHIPWLRPAPSHTADILARSTDSDSVRLAIGDQILDGLRMPTTKRDGRVFQQVQVQVRCVPLSAGTLQLAPINVRFAYANEFREHLLRGREPVDQREQSVVSGSTHIRVLELPTDGPAEWSGAVGDFTLSATSSGPQVHVGDSFQVEVTVVGEGNLDHFAALRPPKLDGFHVQGIVERRVDTGRCFALDVLALRPGLREMPGFPFVAFSPTKKSFVSLTTPTVPVVVLPQPADRALANHIQDLVSADADKLDEGSSRYFIRWAFIILMIAGLWLQRRTRRRKGERSLSASLQQLRLAISQDAEPDRVADAFERVIIRVAGGSTFVAPGIWDDLRARGVESEGVRKLRQLHNELDAARFGGPVPSLEALMSSVDTLVAAANQ